jgi:hypothetical protein
MRIFQGRPFLVPTRRISINEYGDDLSRRQQRGVVSTRVQVEITTVQTKTGMRSDIELIRMAEEAWHPLVNRFYQEALFRGKIMGFFLELND